MFDFVDIILKSFGLGFSLWLFVYGINRIYLWFKGMIS